MEHGAFEQGFAAFVWYTRAAISDISVARARADPGTKVGVFSAYRSGPALGGLKQHGELLRAARRGGGDEEERSKVAPRSEICEATRSNERSVKAAVELAEQCLKLYAERGAGPKSLERIVWIVHQSPESLHKHPARGELGEETNAAIERLCTSALEWSRSTKRSATGVNTDCRAER